MEKTRRFRRNTGRSVTAAIAAFALVLANPLSASAAPLSISAVWKSCGAAYGITLKTVSSGGSMEHYIGYVAEVYNYWPSGGTHVTVFGNSQGWVNYTASGGTVSSYSITCTYRG
jgi:hypothetical protein